MYDLIMLLELKQLRNYSAAYDLKIDAKIDETAVKLYKKANATEYTGLLVVHIMQLRDEKPKLRTAIQATVKVFKAEHIKLLGDNEQSVQPAKLLHPMLQSRISSALKLR